MNDVKIKVCGMTSLKQVQELALIGVDYAGFIFYEKSPRHLGNKIAASDLKYFSDIKKVGVFVNESKEKIIRTIDEYGLDAVQLHGDETPELCESLKDTITVIKAFRVTGDEDLVNMLQPYEDSVDYFLFDTKAKEYGGTGKKFDWSVLEKISINKPYFLSGGIGINDIEQVKLFTSANNVFAVDVNSKFETEPGVKEIFPLKEFVAQIRG
ncbi:phosphoribosylanthranilate isomerase [Niabella ginsengisoli]|uniref:N-(5'-phosphoribosyl)anthranilate isomerase n=1 Tax=Niabella ginsengisoli TaxID=522298 RepID=A0ABS9SFH4_9BACT|nr:phosphoribosylanthranilate isomerase [Niabella ginsengisoli]MCH5597116.1 phosphoribosylanthranilate isomerase [Niabella ginsengisoli]